ncbi:MAG TPA: DUF3108 domain-containing protein [Beijerinckiaceae bacterium]|jgi:hypothetical protein|nr:DUF3108 domain-containing protein [Beijerinckiaceae bacterium]
MSISRFRYGAIPQLVLLAVAFGAACGSAAADTLKARYSISLIGLPLGTAEVTADIEPNSYKLDTVAKLSGIAALISSAKGATTATGAITLGKISPATYSTISASSKMTRTVRMGISGGNVRGIDISPPLEDDHAPDRVPLTEADKHNIIDPMSAVVMPVPNGQPLVGPAACNRSIPIFDGASRFDIDLTYVGTREVSTNGYAGPVAVCAVRYVPIAGYRRNREATRFMADNKQMDVWLAPIASAHVTVPFRISILTLLGTTVIEASEFHLVPSDKAAVR